MRVTLNNDVLMPEVKALIDAGKEIALPVTGNSMLPFIIGGVDSVVLKKASPEELAWPNVVLARTIGGRYVVHRIVSVCGDGGKRRIKLMGDGNISGTETCMEADVIGVVAGIVHGGKTVDAGTWKMRAAAWIWRLCRPLRRYLLAIYRRTFLRAFSRKAEIDGFK